MLKIFKFILIFSLFFPFCASASSLGQKLSGRILLDVERNGEAWYIYPEDYKRYFLGRPADAFEVMRKLGLGITEWDFQKLAEVGMPVAGDIELAKKLSGKIVLEVEKNGEAWYINPTDLKKYYLGRPVDAFRIMRELGLGITREDLALIHKPGMDESIDQYSSYKHINVTAKGVDYPVDVIEINLSDPNLEIVTDTADKYNCKTGCQAETLASYVVDSNGFAGINGTYFESSDQSRLNYYFFPVFNSSEDKLINDDQLKYWTTGPIMVWDTSNKFYYFKDSREFKSVESFESTYGVKIQAMLGNKPRLIEDKNNYLIEWDIDAKQKTVKTLRNAIGYKENLSNPGKGTVYLVVAENATVPDLAEVMNTFDVDYALNLDGGYSSALWYNDEYMVGPGRNIPNAIIFKKK
jgi:hypothetical protein